MRALFLVPGEGSRQLQAFPAVAAVAEGLGAQVQVVCPAAAVPLWSLHPRVERTIPFAFAGATLADWANLLGSVREPDFQLCFNRTRGRQVDLMLSMSHIPTRVAAAGFSATDTVQEPDGVWGAQAWQAFLRPVGVELDAAAFRLALPRQDLDAAAAELPAGDGPLLLLAPAGGAGDWPAGCWQDLPGRIRSRLPDLRSMLAGEGSMRGLAARIASADVVLASDPVSIELALLLGIPLVALGRGSADLPQRDGVKGLGAPGDLERLDPADVLTALGLG
ncbi:glycosyltransferase family 9 protein [Cyanobium sp. CH-040]|uniref:glycosyltransferase family 9 protein n=1 Tax=Cyanobium sp. CH-040 TaxID=2823708 RepID=UPI0020CE16D9|nr:lipopolysaccharide heptosyltransferase family protein [Cyanobium sp. CH-040]MCP9926487.1 glycosyltransferase family 9 protein [Cyanobium sp. CH-040]